MSEDPSAPDGGAGHAPAAATRADATPLAGVLPVVQTPFNSDATVDFGALRTELEWIAEQGVAGVTIGMVTDILRLTVAERLDVAAAVRESTGAVGRTCVVSCVAESTRVASEIARHARSIGADAVMACPPTSTVVPSRALYDYFAAIADGAEIPVVVQDASGYVGQPLSIDLMARLESGYRDGIYFKPEADPVGQRVSELRDATGGRARIFEGLGGAFLVDSYRRGIVGSMPGAEVCWAVQRLWEDLEAGDDEHAYRISGLLMGLAIQQPNLDGFIVVEKYLLARQGVLPSTACRGPMGFELDPETAAELDRLFDRLRVVVDETPAWTPVEEGMPQA